MEKILFGDNQFFAVNHISEEKSRAQSIRFKDDSSIINVLDYARESGINTFMCTTHDRIGNICEVIRSNPGKYQNFKIYPCMPYAHKYANAVTEFGITGALKQYLPGSFFGSLLKGGVAYFSKDYLSVMELLIDAEMKMFRDIKTPVIFLQNVITDLLLGLGMTDVLKAYHCYVQLKYKVEAGFITMNFPRLVSCLEKAGIPNPIICTSINKAGFRMSGGKDLYEDILQTTSARVIAMQIFAGGAIPPRDAIEYVLSLPNIQSVLFGASSRNNIEETVKLIRLFQQKSPQYQFERLAQEFHNIHV